MFLAFTYVCVVKLATFLYFVGCPKHVSRGLCGQFANAIKWYILWGTQYLNDIQQSSGVLWGTQYLNDIQQSSGVLWGTQYLNDIQQSSGVLCECVVAFKSY